MARVIVTAAPCSGVSVIFTVSARRRWRRSAVLPLALRDSANVSLAARSEERTSLPTAAAAPLLSSSILSSPPNPIGDTTRDPCTTPPCGVDASLIDPNTGPGAGSVFGCSEDGELEVVAVGLPAVGVSVGEGSFAGGSLVGSFAGGVEAAMNVRSLPWTDPNLFFATRRKWYSLPDIRPVTVAETWCSALSDGRLAALVVCS